MWLLSLFCLNAKNNFKIPSFENIFQWYKSFSNIVSKSTSQTWFFNSAESAQLNFDAKYLRQNDSLEYRAGIMWSVFRFVRHFENRAPPRKKEQLNESHSRRISNSTLILKRKPSGADSSSLLDFFMFASAFLQWHETEWKGGGGQKT